MRDLKMASLPDYAVNASKRMMEGLFKALLIPSLLLCMIPCYTYASATLRIVVTTSMIGDAVHNIVGDQAHIITLMGPGLDPHSYKATPKNIKDLSQADVIFYNGLHLEGKMGDVLTSFSIRKPVYAVSSGIDASTYLGDLKSVDAIDPHIWFDISIWKQVVAYLSEKLKLINPSQADYYQENTIKYLQELDDLHNEVTKLIQTIPKNQRVLITAHDAFSYFGRAYDIEVRGLQGISTIDECGLRDITNLVEFIIQRKIKAIFPESSVSSKSLQAVVEGCNQKGHRVVLGSELYSDALGQKGTPEGTYIGMVMNNVRTMVEVLQ